MYILKPIEEIKKMNKLIYIPIVFLLCIACNSQQNGSPTINSVSVGNDSIKDKSDEFLNKKSTKSLEDKVKSQADDILFYVNNDSYFSKEIDINNDGIVDKIVSSQRYQGDELLLFIKNRGTYELALKTTNFSEDGGNQILDIKKNETGFVVVTAFPDRGFFESHFFISFENEHWILTHTIYKTKATNEEDSFIYVCNVQQGIDISNSELLNTLRFIPDESERDKICFKQKKSNSTNINDENKQATIDSISISEIKRYIENELPTIFQYYKQEKIEDYSTWSSKMFGRCCSNTDLTFNENLYFKISSNFTNEQYPFTNLSDTQYSTAFAFKPDLEVKIKLQLDLSLDKSFLQGKYSNKNLLKPDQVIMKPIQLSLINGYTKSKKLFYENARVKEMEVYVNDTYKETIVLLDTPLVQQFEVNATFKTNDIITLEPITYYEGTKYSDICISEVQSNLGKIALPILNKKYNLIALMNKK